METKTKKQQIEEIICDKFDVDPESLAGNPTFDDIGMDSLDVVELQMMVDDHFKVMTPDMECISTQRVVQFVEAISPFLGA